MAVCFPTRLYQTAYNRTTHARPAPTEPTITRLISKIYANRSKHPVTIALHANHTANAVYRLLRLPNMQQHTISLGSASAGTVLGAAAFAGSTPKPKNVFTFILGIFQKTASVHGYTRSIFNNNTLGQLRPPRYDSDTCACTAEAPSRPASEHELQGSRSHPSSRSSLTRQTLEQRCTVPPLLQLSPCPLSSGTSRGTLAIFVWHSG